MRAAGLRMRQRLAGFARAAMPPEYPRRAREGHTLALFPSARGNKSCKIGQREEGDRPVRLAAFCAVLLLLLAVAAACAAPMVPELAADTISPQLPAWPEGGSDEDAAVPGLLSYPSAATEEEPFEPSPCPATYGKGWLKRINGYLVLHVEGTPEEMGEQHGVLLRNEVRRMIKDLIYEGEASYGDSYERLITGAMVMEPYQPEEFRRELRALAQAAGVRYEDLVAAQLFGDVWRGGACTSFAFYGPATATGECVVGRNMDFWDHGVTKYGAVLVHYKPNRGFPFVTVTWAGIINGWTLMNIHGLVTANNSAYGGKSESLRGISTCFMLRKVAQYCASVPEAVRVVRWTPRACGTAMIVAGGRPPSAAVIEFDHANVRVRWARRGYVLADNSFHALYVSPASESSAESSSASYGYSYYSRYDILERLAQRWYGKIDLTLPLSKAPGVAISSMNLHTVMLYPERLLFAVSMGKTPATDYPFHWYRLTADGLEDAQDQAPGPPPPGWTGEEETTPSYTAPPLEPADEEQTVPEQSDTDWQDEGLCPDYDGLD